MHAAAFRALAVPHRYDAIRCREDQLEGHVNALRRGDFAGLNVTVPHKRAVLRFSDRRAREVELSGAANTLVLVEGAVVAHNTDTSAITVELERLAPEVRGRRAVVLGSGGAARSAIVALCKDLDVS